MVMYDKLKNSAKIVNNSSGPYNFQQKFFLFEKKKIHVTLSTKNVIQHFERNTDYSDRGFSCVSSAHLGKWRDSTLK
jgi:hypothetical protein